MLLIDSFIAADFRGLFQTVRYSPCESDAIFFNHPRPNRYWPPASWLWPASGMSRCTCCFTVVIRKLTQGVTPILVRYLSDRCPVDVRSRLNIYWTSTGHLLNMNGSYLRGITLLHWGYSLVILGHECCSPVRLFLFSCHSSQNLPFIMSFVTNLGRISQMFAGAATSSYFCIVQQAKFKI